MHSTLNSTSLSKTPIVFSRKPILLRGLRSCLWVMLCLTAVVMLVEAIFHLAHIGEEEYMRFDPLLGYMHFENKQITFRSEGYSSDKINAAGFRDSEHTLAKPADVLRIALLGDSRTESFQVPLSKTFGKRLETMFNARVRPNAAVALAGDGPDAPSRFDHDARVGEGLDPSHYAERATTTHPIKSVQGHSFDGRGQAPPLPLSKKAVPLQRSKVEVLNFGMSAFSTGQEYLLYLNTVRKYRPDVVCVFYNCLDTEENVLPFGDPNPTPRPYFLLANDGRLQLDWSALKNWSTCERARINQKLDWFRRHSRIVGVLTALEMDLQGDRAFKFTSKLFSFLGPTVSRAIKTLPPPAMPNEPTLITLDPLATAPIPASTIQPIKVTAADPSARMFQAMVNSNDIKTQVTEAIFHRLNKACQQDGASLMVTCMPAPNNSFFYFREIKRIQQQSGREGFGYVNLHEAFPSIGPMQPTPYLYDKAHLSLKGHRLASDTIYAGLIRQQLIR